MQDTRKLQKPTQLLFELLTEQFQKQSSGQLQTTENLQQKQ